MCKITNNQATEILKAIRQIEKEGVKTLNKEELTSFYVQAYVLQKELETVMSIVKEKLLQKGIKDQFFPDFQMKIKMTEGKLSTTYDNKAIAKEIGLDAYAMITNVVAKKAGEYADILEKHSKKQRGEPGISVLKMTKKELLESV